MGGEGDQMNEKDRQVSELKEHARRMRVRALQMAHACGASAHLGGALSMMEAMAVLYGAVMNSPSLPDAARDRFILSKGHGVLGLYTALREFGVLDDAQIETFMQDGSDLIAHPVMKPEIGLEASSGSLGQGISMAVGLALAAKKKGYTYQTYVLCGNGEANEGSVWEACMSAINYALDNFTLFLDNNRMQSDGMSADVMNVSDKYAGMLRALGFQVLEIDGNDAGQVLEAFREPHEAGKPKAIVGSTVKGRGVSFMENNNDWHHNRLTKDQLQAALAELGAAETEASV